MDNTKTNRKAPTPEMEAAAARYDRECAEDTAHHESAHAVVEFLYGRERHLVYISMVPDAGFLGRTRLERCFDRLVGEGDGMTCAPEMRGRVRAQVMREIIGNFIGPAVDALRHPEEYDVDGWLSALADDPGDALTDYTEAYRMTGAVATTEPQRWAVLRRGAQWTDELIRVPRVWNTIEALAGQLKYGEIMPGDGACEIMRVAWGDGCFPPLADLGRKWMRRLFPAPPVTK